MAIRGTHGADPAKRPKERRATRSAFIAFLAAIALNACAPTNPDGSAATLADVVAHYNRVRNLNLTADPQRELIEYLKSL